MLENTLNAFRGGMHTCMFDSIKSSSLLCFLKLGFGGMTPFSKTRNVLISPANPAVLSV